MKYMKPEAAIITFEKGDIITESARCTDIAQQIIEIFCDALVIFSMRQQNGQKDESGGPPDDPFAGM